jgi:hypothetical protein
MQVRFTIDKRKTGIMAEKKSILLRLSPKMWEEINQWAEQEFRSVNGQIEYLLQEALNKRSKASGNSDRGDTK